MKETTHGCISSLAFFLCVELLTHTIDRRRVKVVSVSLSAYLYFCIKWDAYLSSITRLVDLANRVIPFLLRTSSNFQAFDWSTCFVVYVGLSQLGERTKKKEMRKTQMSVVFARLSCPKSNMPSRLLLRCHHLDRKYSLTRLVWIYGVCKEAEILLIEIEETLHTHSTASEGT